MRTEVVSLVGPTLCDAAAKIKSFPAHGAGRRTHPRRVQARALRGAGAGPRLDGAVAADVDACPHARAAQLGAGGDLVAPARRCGTGRRSSRGGSWPPPRGPRSPAARAPRSGSAPGASRRAARCGPSPASRSPQERAGGLPARDLAAVHAGELQVDPFAAQRARDRRRLRPAVQLGARDRARGGLDVGQAQRRDLRAQRRLLRRGAADGRAASRPAALAVGVDLDAEVGDLRRLAAGCSSSSPQPAASAATARQLSARRRTCSR